MTFKQMAALNHVKNHSPCITGNRKITSKLCDTLKYLECSLSCHTLGSREDI